MLSGKAIFFSSLETFSANNKHIQMYAEKQTKHSTPGCMFGKSAFPKFVEEKNNFLLPKSEAAVPLFWQIFLQLYSSEYLYLF